jgi:hypothetical protein
MPVREQSSSTVEEEDYEMAYSRKKDKSASVEVIESSDESTSEKTRGSKKATRPPAKKSKLALDEDADEEIVDIDEDEEDEDEDEEEEGVYVIEKILKHRMNSDVSCAVDK